VEPSFVVCCAIGLALAGSACSSASDDGANGEGGAGGRGLGGSGSGGTGSGTAGQTGAGATASGGSGTSGRGAGSGASGGGGAGSGGREAGGSGASGSGAAGSGSGGTGQSQDPCAGMPDSCFEVCQAGQCQCECPNEVPCPASAPTAGAGCDTPTVCGYGEPACHQIFECFAAKWKKVADTCNTAPGGSCPATLSEALATPCVERECGYEAQVCACVSPCSGAFMEPSTFCTEPTPAACIDPYPELGASCQPEGQTCGSSCCGLRWNCVGGAWTTMNVLCPP
jgi:hypothetical protein